jgi:hypothetical protein
MVIMAKIQKGKVPGRDRAMWRGRERGRVGNRKERVRMGGERRESWERCEYKGELAEGTQGGERVGAQYESENVSLNFVNIEYFLFIIHLQSSVLRSGWGNIQDLKVHQTNPEKSCFEIYLSKC